MQKVVEVIAFVGNEWEKIPTSYSKIHDLSRKLKNILKT